MTTSSSNTVLVVDSSKSLGLGIVLTFLFGPLGLLYSTVLGGLLMIVLTAVVSVITLGFGALLGWAISIVWSVVAISMHNGRVRGQRQAAFASAPEPQAPSGSPAP